MKMQTAQLLYKVVWEAAQKPKAEAEAEHWEGLAWAA